MKKLRFGDHLTAEFNDEGVWVCEDPGIEEALNRRTEIEHEEMSHYLIQGHARTYLFNTIAKAFKATEISDDEESPGLPFPDAEF